MRDYAKLIKGTKWSKSDITSFAKALNSMKYDESRNPERMDRISSLWYEFQNRGRVHYNLTAEQTEQGISYLRSRYFKKNGEPRKSCPFNEAEQAVIKTFKKFTFSSIYVERNDYGMEWYHPVYTVFGKNGDKFEYAPLHWSNPIIFRDNQVVPTNKQFNAVAYLSDSWVKPELKVVRGGK